MCGARHNATPTPEPNPEAGGTHSSHRGEDQPAQQDLHHVDKSGLQKLTEDTFREILDYKLPPAPPITVHCFQFVEKIPEQKGNEASNVTRAEGPAENVSVDASGTRINRMGKSRSKVKEVKAQ